MLYTKSQLEDLFPNKIGRYSRVHLSDKFNRDQMLDEMCEGGDYVNHGELVIYMKTAMDIGIEPSTSAFGILMDSSNKEFTLAVSALNINVQVNSKDLDTLVWGYNNVFDEEAYTLKTEEDLLDAKEDLLNRIEANSDY